MSLPPSLSAEETEQLFAVIRSLQGKGVGIIYISHKMRRNRAIGDRVTILKDGKRVTTMDMKDVKDENQIVSPHGGQGTSASNPAPTQSGWEPAPEVALRVEKRHPG